MAAAYDLAERSTLLVDGDLVAYRSAAGVQQNIDWGEGVQSRTGDVRTALRVALATIGAAQSHTGCREVVMAFSDKVNFRKSILPSYKSNRKAVEKPDCLSELIAMLTERFEGRVYVRPGLEADDVLGILATNRKVIPGRKVIYSADKDMRSIPGDLYDGKSLIRISIEQADRQHLMQTLTGDPSDGYCGCPRVGPVKAARIIDDALAADGVQATAGGSLDAVWPAIVAAYVRAGLDEPAALQQARVARILRTEDYCYKSKRPILWSPKSIGSSGQVEVTKAA